MRFPPPARNAATRTHSTRTNRGQRPTRRARSARRWRGGRLPGALGPRRAWDRRGAVAGAMAPAMATAQFRPPPGGTPKRMRFPRPRGTLPPGPVPPAPTEASARRGRGGRWPGALGPRRTKDQLGTVAGAMAPAMATMQFRRRFGRDQETHCVSPARAELCHQDPCHPHQQRPAPGPAGEKRPPWGGAGAGRGLWAPGRREGSGALWQGRWPLPGCGRARRRKRCPRSGQAAPAVGTFSAACQSGMRLR